MTNKNNEDLPKPILIEDLGMIFPTESSKKKARYGVYKCGFCGTKFRASTSAVVRGKSRSCGCYNKRRVIETHTKHGLWSTKLYEAWKNMKARTLNLKHRQYIDYGGRGITLCEEWKNDFKSFYDWSMSNGYEENKGLSIDRIDNDGNYCPENCRWTTKSIQSRNQRIMKNNTSGYRGVYFRKDINKYKAQIYVNNKNKGLGHFSTPVEGAIAYNNFIIENNLEGFILNEIPEEYLEKGDYK